MERLKVFGDLIIVVDQAVKQLSRELEAKAPKVLPKGMGRLTYEAVETEVADWARFCLRRRGGWRGFSPTHTYTNAVAGAGLVNAINDSTCTIFVLAVTQAEWGCPPAARTFS